MTSAILACGFPRSGTHWLAWLLAGAIRCPLIVDKHGKWEEKYAGCTSEYSIYRTHWLRESRGSNGSKSLIYDMGRFNGNEKRVVIIRDIRDIIVSRFFYMHCKVSLEQCIKDVAIWGKYNARISSGALYVTSYEKLRENARNELKGMLEALGLYNACKDNIEAAIHENTAKATAAFIEKQKKKWWLPPQFLRKAQVGDWRNHLTNDMLDEIYAMHGEYMRACGYSVGEYV